MTQLDWIVLGVTQLFIIVYGIWKSRGSKNVKTYLLANKEMRWATIGISIIATQASAITFLSTPGQAFGDGMRFVQFYIAMPLAMVILSVTAVPLYHRLKVYTAYEFLEKRFDLRMRIFTAGMFLIQRSMAAGLSIYAPAIILSKVLGWDTGSIAAIVGLMVIAYTVSGGAKAVSYTQKQQMGLILIGMFVATYYLISGLPSDISFSDTLHIAGKTGRLDVINFEVDFSDRYNFWSGILGGLFLFLSYFGTDQSQVQRYLGGRSITESRMGLLLNGLIKVPMQFAILFIGVLLFVFYQFHLSPIYFNSAEKNQVYQSEQAEKFKVLEKDFEQNFIEKQAAIRQMLSAIDGEDKEKTAKLRRVLSQLTAATDAIRNEAAVLVKKTVDSEFNEQNLTTVRKKDRDFVFITFVMNVLPVGLIGLLISMILAAAMSSASAELSALGATSFNDIYKRVFKPQASSRHYLNISKLLTVCWGFFAILFAQYADKLENLIQAVNILGSLVYGTILGIFLVAFFLKNVGSKATFYAALIAESFVLLIHFTDMGVPYLWYNVIGCLPVLLLAWLFQRSIKRHSP